jgi:HlyD family secretion protein
MKSERLMVRKYRAFIVLAALVLIAAALGFYWLGDSSKPPQLQLAKAVRRDIKMAINTNGIIEPVNRAQIYSPIDGFVKTIQVEEGAEIVQGQILMHLETQQIRTDLAVAKASLLEARRETQLILAGPPKEEVTAVDASIAENSLNLDQLVKDLQIEESLKAKGATPQEAVDKLLKQKAQLQLQSENLKAKKQDLYTRYSEKEKEWAQGKVAELTKQVELLEQQLQSESIFAPASGLIFSLAIKSGTYVSRGQLLAEIYKPGNIRLRAYVDEPDLGRIQKGQPALIEWNGLPERQWTGAVEKPAEQVVALNNRSVGYVLCSIADQPKELIPNLNIQVEITTALKINALVVPKSAVFNRDGKPVVLLSEGLNTVVKPVEYGLFNSKEIEILAGIKEGDSVVTNPGEVKTTN